MFSPMYEQLKAVHAINYDEAAEQESVRRINNAITTALEEAHKYRRDPRMGGKAAEAAIMKLDEYITALEQHRDRLQHQYKVHAEARQAIADAKTEYASLSPALVTAAEYRMHANTPGKTHLPEEDLHALQTWRNEQRENQAKTILDKMNAELMNQSMELNNPKFQTPSETRLDGSRGASGSGWGGDFGSGSSTAGGGASSGSGSGSPAGSAASGSGGVVVGPRPGGAVPPGSGSGVVSGEGSSSAPAPAPVPPSVRIPRGDGSVVVYEPPGIGIDDPKWDPGYRPPGTPPVNAGAAAGVIGVVGAAGGAAALRAGAGLTPQQMLQLGQATGAGSAGGMRPGSMPGGSSAGLSHPLFGGRGTAMTGAGMGTGGAPNIGAGAGTGTGGAAASRLSGAGAGFTGVATGTGTGGAGGSAMGMMPGTTPTSGAATAGDAGRAGKTPLRGPKLATQPTGTSGKPILSVKPTASNTVMPMTTQRRTDEERDDERRRTTYQVTRIDDPHNDGLPEWYDSYGPGHAPGHRPDTSNGEVTR